MALVLITHNMGIVAEMCDLTIPFPKGSERYPKYPLTPEITARTDRAGYLRELCLIGLRHRYGFDAAAPEKFADPVLAKTLVEPLLRDRVALIAKPAEPSTQTPNSGRVQKLPGGMIARPPMTATTPPVSVPPSEQEQK